MFLFLYANKNILLTRTPPPPPPMYEISSNERLWVLFTPQHSLKFQKKKSGVIFSALPFSYI